MPEGINFARSPQPALAAPRTQHHARRKRKADLRLAQPYMPDMYASRSHESETATFPLLKPSEAYSTVASPATHLGGGPSSTASAAQ